MMWSISEVKETGKKAFKANYWPCVLMALVMSVFAGGAGVATHSKQQSVDFNTVTGGTDPGEMIAVLLILLGVVLVVAASALVVRIFISNPIRVGGCHFFRCNVEEAPAPFSLIKTGFQNYWHNFWTLFLRDLFLVLWSLLFLVPGLIKAYSYSMVPFILAENPEMPAKEVITRSREMMDGNKWQTFQLDLSFIGWFLFGVVTLGLGFILWTLPYMNSTRAALYLKLKAESAE